MKKLPPVLKALRAIRRLLSKKERWTKHISARTKRGDLTVPSSSDAYSFCLSGALTRISQQSNLPERERIAIYYSLQIHILRIPNIPEDLANFGPNRVIVEYNDLNRTQHKDILNLLDNTISSYEKKGKEHDSCRTDRTVSEI